MFLNLLGNSGLACGPTIREALETSGQTEASVDVLQAALRPQSLEVYGRHRKEFCSFLSDKGSNPRDVSLALVVEFLRLLAHSLNLKLPTIRSYVLAIRYPLSWVQHSNILDSPLLKLFMKGLRNRAPVVRQTPVQGNLDVVLRHLHAIEPLSSLPVLDLLKKSLFLVTLASGRRIGEIAHLGLDKPFLVIHKSDLVLVYMQSFLAKNETSQSLHPQIQLKAIQCAPNSKERFLCPVRALLHLLQHIRGKN